MQRGFLSKNNEAALVAEFMKQTVARAKKVSKNFRWLPKEMKIFLHENFQQWIFSKLRYNTFTYLTVTDCYW